MLTASLLLLGALLAGCATSQPMDTYVPARCHGVASGFSSYTLAFQDVPGFIEGVIEDALEGALIAQGLDEAPEPETADIRVVSTFYLIDRNPPPPLVEDPFGEQVQSGTVNRFVAHLDVNVYDRATEAVLWTGAMYRAHAIRGGETFHDERAVLLIRQAFDDMFVGLTTPCD
ncbi:MAG: hypothetical protein AAGE43_06455 [Pseudomonadota bacterium]